MNHWLVSKEDLDRIDRLEAERAGDRDVVWACQLARKLSRLKPTEAQFPENLAVINQANCTAIPVRFAESCFVEHVFELKDGKGLFEYMLSCESTDAFLVIRPYVRVVIPQEQAVLDRLEKGKLMVHADGSFISVTPIAEVLVGLDGYGVRRKPFLFRLPVQHEPNIFGVASLDALGEIATPGGLGIFLPNTTKVRIELETPAVVDRATVSVGLVMARYTTKGIATPVLGSSSRRAPFPEES